MPSKYGYEVVNVGVAPNLIQVTPFFESGYEAISVAMLPTEVGDREWPWEVKSVLIASGGAPPLSFESDFEVKSVGITQFFNVGVVSPEFDYETRNITVATVGLDVNSGEWRYEIMGQGGTNVGVQSAEIDFELKPVFLQFADDVRSAEYAYEWGSLIVTQDQVLGVSRPEFDREFGSVSLANISYEHGYEVKSVFFNQISNQGTVTPSEYGHELGSPALTQLNIVRPVSAEFGREIPSVGLPGNSVQDTFEFEWGWESRSVRIRHMKKNPHTPRDRIKHVRV